MKFCAFYVCLLVSIYGCAPVEVREAVMTDGMKICATTIDGEICILAKDKIRRQFFWRDFEKTIVTIPRESRWDGMLGLYYPGNERWVNNEGIFRGIYEEGQYHITNNKEVLSLFENGNYEKGNYVYTSDGIALFYKIIAKPGSNKHNVITIALWQFMINGQRPVNLPGSHDNNITVYR